MLGFNLWFLVFFDINMGALKVIVFSVQAVVSSFICGVVIYQIIPSFKEAMRLLFLFDKIFLNALITSIAFTHQIIILY
jgi:hypothetical protein